MNYTNHFYHWLIVNEDIDITNYVKDVWKKGNLVFITNHYPGKGHCTRENEQLIMALPQDITVSSLVFPLQR